MTKWAQRRVFPETENTFSNNFLVIDFGLFFLAISIKFLGELLKSSSVFDKSVLLYLGLYLTEGVENRQAWVSHPPLPLRSSQTHSGIDESTALDFRGIVSYLSN